MTTLSQSNSRSFISVINVLCYYCQNIASILQFISFFNHHVVIYCTGIIDAIPYIDNVGISLKNFPLDIFHPPVYYNPLLITFSCFPELLSAYLQHPSIPDSRIFAFFTNNFLFDDIWIRRFIIQLSSPLIQFGVNLLHNDILLTLIIRDWRKRCPEIFSWISTINNFVIIIHKQVPLDKLCTDGIFKILLMRHP